MSQKEGTHLHIDLFSTAVLRLKMLGLYLDTLIIGHKCCSIFSMLNKLPLQKELQTLM